MPSERLLSMVLYITTEAITACPECGQPLRRFRRSTVRQCISCCATVIVEPAVSTPPSETRHE